MGRGHWVTYVCNRTEIGLFETDMDALSNRFRVFDVTCVTLLVNQVVVPI